MTLSDRLERVEDALDRLTFLLQRGEERQQYLRSVGRHDEAQGLSPKLDRLCAKTEALHRELQVLLDMQEERRAGEEELLRREYRRVTRYRNTTDS